ncbi:TlpA family protein disulfide reductase [Metabacillus litoralis]|uniref:TlpA family protein disulfide reductase n=1 Tax=Metabacillus litoralis TaxID=152268 RepID=UPI001CFEC89B|nr:TlpA disulfide reductase family protein [Metabacillus litoralis]
MKRKTFFIVLIILISTAYHSELMAIENNENIEKEKAPEFSISTLSGETISLSDFKGDLIILNFWTTWCTYCQEEMAELNKFSKENNSSNVHLIGINVTSSEQSEKSVEQFIKHFDVPFPIGLDESGKIAKKYKLIGIPTTLIIDENGMIQNKIMGPVTSEMLNEIIASN